MCIKTQNTLRYWPYRPRTNQNNIYMETPKQPQSHSMTPITVHSASWGVHIIYQIPWEHSRNTAGQSLLMNNTVQQQSSKTMPIVRRPTPSNDQRSTTMTIQNNPCRTTVLSYNDQRPRSTTNDHNQRPRPIANDNGQRPITTTNDHPERSLSYDR